MAQTKISGFHIDDIDPSLSNLKKLWLDKAIEFYKIACILTKQLRILSNVYLVLYLKDRRKNLNLRSNKKEFINDFSYSPPEIILSSNNFFKSQKNSPNLNFIPKEFKYYLIKKYDKDSRSYQRHITVSLNEHLKSSFDEI